MECESFSIVVWKQRTNTLPLLLLLLLLFNIIKLHFLRLTEDTHTSLKDIKVSKLWQFSFLSEHILSCAVVL